MEIFFGKDLKYLRLYRGLNQTELGEMLGVKKSMVGRYEAGESQPTLENVIFLSDFFDVRVDSFLREDISTIYGNDKGNINISPNQKQKGRNLKQSISIKTGYTTESTSLEYDRLLKAKDDVINALQETIRVYKFVLKEK